MQVFGCQVDRVRTGITINDCVVAWFPDDRFLECTALFGKYLANVWHIQCVLVPVDPDNGLWLGFQ